MKARVLVLALLAGALALGSAAAEATDDEKLLQGLGVAAHDDGLLAFFRQRSPSAEEVESLIRRLGSDDLAEREKASRLLCACGPKAVPLLKEALDSPDAEVRDRARRCVDFIESASATRYPGAAARLLARRAPPGAVPALLDYLPFAGDPLVEDEVFAALLVLTPEAGKADAALAQALRDPSAVKRAAAYVLGRKGEQEQTAEVRKLLSDRDANVRLRAALALLAGRDKDAPPALIELLAEGPDDLRWRAENALLRLAGDQAPPRVPGDDADARRKRRDLWAAWWKDNADKLAPARFEDFDHPLGYTLAIEFNTRRVWECAADGTLRWELRELAGPMDAQVLPNGRVLVAEALSRTVREYDLKGNVKWEVKLEVEPNACRRLANGDTFVTAADRVMEFALDGSAVYSFDPKRSPKSNAICPYHNGHVLITSGDEIAEVDTTGKEGWSAWLPPPGKNIVIEQDLKLRNQHRPGGAPQPRRSGGAIVDVCELAGDRVLTADSENGRVVELDSAGRVQWEAHVPGVCGVFRTPGGGTLATTNHKVIELNRDGQVIWEKAAEGYPRRVYRR
jgi:hypothetical protein